jgi:ribulose-phosphate 3-epimerase
MDGVFVPNISFGQGIVGFMNKASTKPLDVHLMIVQPERYIESFRTAGAEIITVHLEACSHLHRTIQQIKDTGAKAGVAINPHSSISLVEDIIQDVDVFCLMSVNPGFGGQKFIHRTLDKIRMLKELILAKGATAKIEIDGGVGLQNAESILAAGADILVAGSSVFKSDNPIETILSLKNIEQHKLV